jgi:hypothetical protein
MQPRVCGVFLPAGNEKIPAQLVETVLLLQWKH